MQDVEEIITWAKKRFGDVAIRVEWVLDPADGNAEPYRVFARWSWSEGWRELGSGCTARASFLDAVEQDVSLSKVVGR